MMLYRVAPQTTRGRKGETDVTTETRSHPLILVASDNLEAGTGLARALLRSGYEVVHCRTPERLVELLESKTPCPYDLLICNVELLEYEAGRALESLNRAGRLPPVVMLRRRGVTVGLRLLPVDVLEEPFDTGRQLAAIRRVLPLTRAGKRRKAHAAARPAKRPAKSPSAEREPRDGTSQSASPPGGEAPRIPSPDKEQER